MNSSNWEDFEFLGNEYLVEQESKTKTKNRKRKWREIEFIKEQRRLKRELEGIDSYIP